MKTITCQELNQQLLNQSITLIDVREPSEYASEHIAQAKLIPLGQIHTKDVESITQPIAIHCKSGKRSMQACEKLLKERPELDVASLDGGIEAWKRAGLSIQKSQQMSLERQTQVAIGAMLVLFCLLGYLASPIFLALPGLMGAGLIFAGIRGLCGITMLLKKMPWNQ